MVSGCEKARQRWEVGRSQVEATERRELPVPPWISGVCGVQGKTTLEDPRWPVISWVFHLKLGKPCILGGAIWSSAAWFDSLMVLTDGNNLYSKTVGMFWTLQVPDLPNYKDLNGSVVHFSKPLTARWYKWRMSRLVWASFGARNLVCERTQRL